MRPAEAIQSLALPFLFGLSLSLPPFLSASCGRGGVSSIRFRTSSSRRSVSLSCELDMARRPPKPREISYSDDVCIAVGLVTIEWSYLHAWLERILTDLAGIDRDYAGLVTYRMDARALMDRITSVANERFADNRAALEDLRDALIEVEACRNKRNALIHNRWNISRKEDRAAQMVMRTTGSKRNRRLVAEFEIRHPEEIYETVERIGQAEIALSEWRINHLFPTVGWPAYEGILA